MFRLLFHFERIFIEHKLIVKMNLPQYSEIKLHSSQISLNLGVSMILEN